MKQHPELIVPAYKRAWAKLPSESVRPTSVLRTQSGDYLLVEIEVPIRNLFRKDGHPQQDLVLAQNQTADWWRYVEDNLATVRHELSLTEISAEATDQPSTGG